jgi:hypothetical protein
MYIGGIDMPDDFVFKYYSSPWKGWKDTTAVALDIVWGRGLNSITMWFESDDERGKFVDALLAHEMDYRMTKDGTWDKLGKEEKNEDQGHHQEVVE